MQELCKANERMTGAVLSGRHQVAVHWHSANVLRWLTRLVRVWPEGSAGSCAPHRRSASALSCVARRWYVLLRIWSPASGSRQWAS